MSLRSAWASWSRSRTENPEEASRASRVGRSVPTSTKLVVPGELRSWSVAARVMNTNEAMNAPVLVPTTVNARPMISMRSPTARPWRSAITLPMATSSSVSGTRPRCSSQGPPSAGHRADHVGRHLAVMEFHDREEAPHRDCPVDIGVGADAVDRAGGDDADGLEEVPGTRLGDVQVGADVVLVGRDVRPDAGPEPVEEQDEHDRHADARGAGDEAPGSARTFRRPAVPGRTSPAPDAQRGPATVAGVPSIAGPSAG